MATKLFLLSAAAGYGTGNNDAALTGTATTWEARALSTSAGASLVASPSRATVAGPTNGLESAASGAAVATVWYSPPLDADITISGSITWNIWASEVNMADNVAINGRLEVIDGATGVITLIDQTARIVEVAQTTRAVNNFAETPAAGVVCKRGDRLRVRIFGDDAGTMGAAGGFNISYNGPTGATDGDTWLQLTENLTFVSEPAGTQVFPTDTASAVSTASVDREAWTSRGAGVQTDVTNTVAGFTAPIQVTDTAGGTVVDWFTRPLTAFTLGGAVRVNARASGATNTGAACEVAVVANDGTGATVWAKGNQLGGWAGTETVLSWLIAGADVAITAGQRLRIRFYIDDRGDVAMTGSSTVTTYYAGAAAATGDTYLTFTQTLTELVSADVVPFGRIPQYVQHLPQ